METLLMILPALFGFLFVIGIPILVLYVIYRMIKGLMTHNAELKRQQDNDRDRQNNPENRWNN